jgi:curved DNA-binding protein CbpA
VAASAVFKRAAEAYNVLRKPALRQRYDQELRKGQVKLDEQALVQPKKKFEQRTLLMIARTPSAKKHAARADEALAKGDLEGARVALISANQHDPHNDELQERLQILYEALMLEPGDL